MTTWDDFAGRAAERRRRRAILRLAVTPALAGVTVEARADGVVLSGWRLRWRAVTEVAIRRFGR